jgi:hypothetical protein
MRLPDSEKRTRGANFGLSHLLMIGAVLWASIGSDAPAAVVTLQEGVHTYNGCEDSYVFYYGHAPSDSNNYGANTNLLLDSQHFTPG